MNDRLAVIDLGTNTFQLIVATKSQNGALEIIHQKSIPSRIGKDGINRDVITPDATDRAVAILNEFKSDLSNLGLNHSQVSVFGTSAIRNAENKDLFLQRIAEGPGFKVQVIDGNAEADLIYKGVRQAVELGESPHLIMDIGGGSVEFIIADQENVFWKRSFEIGGQRLLERFVRSEPVSGGAIRQINSFLDQQLIPLSNAIHQYAPQTLVGSSGSFETLAEMDHWRNHNAWPPASEIAFDITFESFQLSSDLILSTTREERLLIRGMKELRADLIIVAIPLIQYILKTYRIKTMKASRYSLKEGALSTLL